MRSVERLKGLKAWAIKNLCEGRNMKAPAENQDIGVILWKKPETYLGWAPSRFNRYGVPLFKELPKSTIPSIIIMPNQSYAHYVEEKRFDRYNNIHRPQDMSQNLGICMLFSVYEPGVRLPGFVDSVGKSGENMDVSLILEGTEQGLFTVMNWMDDCMELLLGKQMIPGTDLSVQEQSVSYGLYTDQKYVQDMRPLYYGYVNVVFNAHVNSGFDAEIAKLL